MPYTEQSAYNKFQASVCSKPECHPHTCGCKSDDKCGCCPPGLVATYNDDGVHLACLTPNDAELFQKNTFTCKDGYVKLVRTSDGVFMGCVSESAFAELYAAVNP